MPLDVRLRRLAYRAAHALLRIYWFLVRPPVSGVKCVLTDGPHVLLVRHTYGTPSWDLPGGAVKRGESPPITAEREMREELGVTIDDWTSLGEVQGRMHHRRDTLHCFTRELRDPALRIDPVEIATVRWFRRDQLPAPLGGYVQRVLALTADP